MTQITRYIAIIAILHAFHGLGHENVVYYGTASNSLNVSFVDTSLSAEAQAAIGVDLQICLRDWGQATTLDIEGCKPGWSGYLDNPAKNPHYPAENKFPKKVVANENNELNLVIPKNLSDAYTNAFVFAAANSNIVAAAYQFVSFVSSPAFVNMPHSELPNYLFMGGKTTSEVVAKAEQLISDLQCQTYYPPSLLGFIYLPNGPEATNLWVLIPCSSHVVGDHFEWSHYPAIWHDNKWKFGFGVWQDE